MIHPWIYLRSNYAESEAASFKSQNQQTQGARFSNAARDRAVSELP
jgi:hypothetical protein